MSKVQDMTKGNPFKLIVMFALPLMLGNIFQQLYTVVDAIIVGRAIGVNALAAVGAVDWINWMMVAMAQGLAQGFAIQIAQDYGSNDYHKLRKTLGNTVVLSLVSTVFLVILGQWLVGPALEVLNVPSTIYNDANVYLRIIYGGIPIVMFYNLAASILRSLGNGKTPLTAMIVASLTNIILDIIFVVFFKWGVAGAAIATILAQLLSGIVCLKELRKIDFIKLVIDDYKIDSKLASRLFYLGLPMALQNILIGIGGIVITGVVNTYGVLFIAGFTATNKLYGILEIAATSFGYALTTYVGQNLGAGNIKRIREGLKVALQLSLIVSISIAALMIFGGKWMLHGFINGTAEEIAESIKYAYEYLSIMSICLPVLYLLHCVRSTLQGAGNTVMPMVSGLAEFVMRTGAALTLPALIGYQGLFIGEVLAWIGADIILVSSYVVMIKKLVKNQGLV